MSHDWVYHLATSLLALGAAIAWTFVLMYRRYDWKATDAGRHLMGFTLAVAVILTLATETRIFGPYPGIQFVAVGMYAWLVYLLASRLRLLIKANRDR